MSTDVIKAENGMTEECSAESMDTEHAKKALRKQMLQRRDAMSAQERTQKSGQIMQNFLASEWYAECERVFCYVSFRSEVDTQELIKHMLSDGKKVAVPRVEGKEMNFYEIRDLADCEPGSFGILEPKNDGKSVIPAKNGKNTDLMIVPGSCFTTRCDRIGYGGGFYDRFLAKHPIKTVGFFFDCQKADMIPCNEYDRKLDHVITESVLI